MLLIRPATPADVSAITDIYNDAILHTTATFDLEEKTEAGRLQWLQERGERHPVLVAEVEGSVIGWAALSRWNQKPAYDTTAEVSLYVHREFRQQGVGRRLLEVLVAEGERLGFHVLVALITHGNEHSIRLHERLGFSLSGTLREIGHKFGSFQDVHVLQRISVSDRG